MSIHGGVKERRQERSGKVILGEGEKGRGTLLVSMEE